MKEPASRAFGVVRRRDGAVVVLAVGIAIAFAHAVAAADAVPFPTSVPLTTAIKLAWVATLATPHRLAFGVVVIWIALSATFALAARREIRWACVGVAILTGLPGAFLVVAWPSALWKTTIDVFTRPMDGESWEWVPLVSRVGG